MILGLGMTRIENDYIGELEIHRDYYSHLTGSNCLYLHVFVVVLVFPSPKLQIKVIDCNYFWELCK